MERIDPRIHPSFLGFICVFLGHNYGVSRKITNHIHEYKCVRCRKEVTDNYSGKIEVLTNKRRETNECLSSFFQKRSKVTLH